MRKKSRSNGGLMNRNNFIALVITVIICVAVFCLLNWLFSDNNAAVFEFGYGKIKLIGKFKLHF